MLICANCKARQRSKCKKRFWTIKKVNDVKQAKKYFKNESINKMDKLCKKCYLQLRRYITSKKNIISSPISSTSSASSASYEIENPKTYIEIDVPCCTSSEKVCIVCRETTTRPKVPDMLRLNTYFRYNFYIPKGVRCCRDHYLNLTLYKDSFDRIIRISNTSSIPVDDFKWLLDESFKNQNKNSLLKSFTEKTITCITCKQITGLTKDNFYDLVSKLKSLKNSSNRNNTEAVAIFLNKLKTNLSYEAMSAFFAIRNASLIGHICDEVVSAFKKDIIPYYIGASNITRDFLLSRQSEIAKRLYPDAPLILIADGTYAYHQKSRNNLYQRKSYSVHKNTNLCKPFTIVTSDGYIVDFFGPFLATANDAKIMKSILTTEHDFLSLLRKNDSFIVDRGFRDCIDFVKSLGFSIEMPTFIKKGEKQLSSLEANKSRIVTKVRWVVEAIHGIVKKKWSFLSAEICNQSLVHVKDYFRIAGCLHNLYGSKLESDKGETDLIVNIMTEKASKSNDLYDYLKETSLINKRSVFQKISADQLEDFPFLEIDHIKLLTLGSYQIAKGISYVAEHNETGGFPLSVCKIERGLIKLQIQSRHISAKTYKVFIRYRPFGAESDSILGYYCECKCGSRTVGCCIHITSIILYLSNLRYDSKEYAPAKKLSNLFDSAEVIIDDNSDED